MVMCVNEFETKENKIWTKDKIEPQHVHPINMPDSFYGALNLHINRVWL